MSHVVTFRASGEQVTQTSIQAHTLDQATLQIPNGAYTVFPIYEGWQVAFLDRHFSRLDKTIELLHIDTKLDYQLLRKALRQCVEMAGFPQARLRLTLPASQPNAAFISIESWQPLAEELYQQGVCVITSDVRRDMPQAKHTHFIAPRHKLISSLPDDIHEAILYNTAGDLLEGSGSNFYAVLNGKLHTAPDTTMYGGVARSILLDASAQEPQLPIAHTSIRLSDLPAISEAMLSSISRGVLPVVEIDGKPVSDGKPGPMFAELRRRYQTIHRAALQDL